MKVIILAGGLGTRLHPYTLTLPKPLVPVGSRPILEIVIAQLKNYGLTDITLAVNHMSNIIMAYFTNGDGFGVNISYSLEKERLGTVGPLRLVEHELSENFIVMNGDILSDINFDLLIKSHKDSRKIMTIATFERQEIVDYGVLNIGNDGCLESFHEKPNVPFSVSTGIYVFNKKIIDYIPHGSMGMDQLISKLMHSNIKINTFQHNGYWLDIGRPADYQKANDDATMFD